jgi:hypothetical protein
LKKYFLDVQEKSPIPVMIYNCGFNQAWLVVRLEDG